MPIFNGTPKSDTIIGSSEDDVVNAGEGNDRIYADGNRAESGGNDIIDAGEGNDIVYSFGGNDVITLGEGYDATFFNATTGGGVKGADGPLNSGHSIITDFNPAEDKIGIIKINNPEENLKIYQEGGDTVIRFENNPDMSIRLENVDASDLTFGPTLDYSPSITAITGDGGTIQVDGLPEGWVPDVIVVEGDQGSGGGTPVEPTTDEDGSDSDGDQGSGGTPPETDTPITKFPELDLPFGEEEDTPTKTPDTDGISYDGLVEGDEIDLSALASKATSASNLQKTVLQQESEGAATDSVKIAEEYSASDDVYLNSESDVIDLGDYADVI